ncbi:Aerobic respiration control sensor protein ArcB [Posidoniimonas corsicana]|uniref:histidine kinase n=1 Tax=Posidoniimonas corsicana TaxID=1938618 RepID=A0A5C5VIT9_9BACT|nr:response regulator [Posidoniimonas corsicana]TWT37612.1 Aerobic respiration control sensor protein ArcB [Posidoniimonas corsicana]
MSRRSILIIDDSPEDREAVMTALRRDQESRYEFVEASTGAAGLTEIRNPDRSFDLAVLDFHLPDMDAERFVESLIDGDTIPPLSIVLLTGSMTDDLDLEILQRGVQDFFSKSLISPELLPRIAKNAIERHGLMTRLVASERKAEEAMMVAERANRAKSQFLASISHELRTPLAAIVGFADILQKNPNAADADRMLGMIASSGEHLTTLVNDLLDIAKIEAGTLEVDAEPCDVQQVVEMVCNLMQHRAADSGLRFHWSVTPRCPTCVRLDAVRLKQILINLIGNGIKYTESGAVRCEMEYDYGTQTVVVRVADTGPGIHPDIQQRLFTPFVQGPTGADNRRAGIGLGLSISRQLAQLMDGKLELESTSENGSVFCLAVHAPEVTDTLVEASNQRAASEPRPVDICRGQRVLVAEDVRANQYLMEKLLKRLEISPEFAADGKEAVEKVERAAVDGDPYRLVLMDMQMPVMDGYEATKRVKAARPDLSVVALTAAALKGDRKRCMAAGCDDVLHKPIDYKKLESTLVRFMVEAAAR